MDGGDEDAPDEAAMSAVRGHYVARFNLRVVAGVTGGTGGDQAAEPPALAFAPESLAIRSVKELTPLEGLLLAGAGEEDGEDEEGAGSVDLTGHRVWLSAQVLARHLLGRFGGPNASAPGRALELGTGTGFAGLVLAAVGAGKVFLSDREASVLDLAQANARLNGLEAACEPLQLSWATEAPASETALGLHDSMDLVVASDCLYDVASIPLLLATAWRFVRKGGLGQLVLCNCQNRLFLAREAAEALMEAAGLAAGFASMERVPVAELWRPDASEDGLRDAVRDSDQEISLLIFKS